MKDPFHEYCISVFQAGRSMTFPGPIHGSPADWDFEVNSCWPLEVVSAQRPFPLFLPLQDIGRLSFTRIGDNIRHGIFRLVEAPGPGTGALRLSLPSELDPGLEDYTASLYVGDRIAHLRHPDRIGILVITARGLHPDDEAFVTLVESDGTSWGARIALSREWEQLEIPLDELHPARGVMLPQGFPGNWNYWLEPPEGRGGPSDRIRIKEIEHLQLSVRPGIHSHPDPGVEIASVSVKTK